MYECLYVHGQWPTVIGQNYTSENQITQKYLIIIIQINKLYSINWYSHIKHIPSK